MIKNLLIYLVLFFAAFCFNIFYYAWFSWFLLLTVAAVPVMSLAVSLPFMVSCAAAGIDISCDSYANMGEDIIISVSGKKRSSAFCPMLRLKMKAVNTLTGKERKIKPSYSGTFSKPLIRKYKSLSEHCGQIVIYTGWAKIYDMLGIFFIPVKLGKTLTVSVFPVPYPPKVLPDCSKIAVTGYKPKPSGTHGEDYDLREYRSGDSVRNIHWKLSSKTGKIIIKEPTVPILKSFVLIPMLSDGDFGDDAVLEKLRYSCKYLVKNAGECYADDAHGGICRMSTADDIYKYFNALYTGKPFNRADVDLDNCYQYLIFADYEEVRAR